MIEGAKSRFEKAADALGVDPAIRETMWRRIGDLQLSPDDPTVVFLAVAGVLEKAAIDIPAAISEFPQNLRDAAKEAVEPLTAAAVVTARERVAAELAKTVEESKGEVRQAAMNALRELSSRREGQARFLQVAGLCLVTAVGGGMGYAAGRMDEAQTRHEGEALAARADVDSWLALMRANGDMAKTLRDNCGVGGKGVYVVQGARACAPPLWLDTPPGAPANAVGRAFTFVGWIAGLPTTIWAVLGVAVGFVLKRFVVEFGRRRSVRWLLEL
ncbi:hypothetical protein [Methylocystis iwaonis]|uniref:hypothetical protein n=1 Tax=Methylocystis iwaonis TaxID=2885079 RepID=UPI002E7BEE0C|nr:hypothetical protein [Methylocystis iwaonis]